MKAHLALVLLVQVAIQKSNAFVGLARTSSFRGEPINRQSNTQRALRSNVGVASTAMSLEHVNVIENVWNLYQHALSQNAWACDSATAASIYVSSDAVTQVFKGGWDWKRLAGRAFFGGCIDGNMEHVWFLEVDKLLPNHDILSTLEKAGMDGMIYTPTYCFLFLGISALLEGSAPKQALASVKDDLPELLKATLLVWLPANLLIYGVVPLEYRVLASAVMLVFYTLGLSFWESEEEGAENKIAVEPSTTMFAPIPIAAFQGTA